MSDGAALQEGLARGRQFLEKRAEQILEIRGVKVQVPRIEEFILPQDLASLSDQHLCELLYKAAALACYLEEQLSKAEIKEGYAKSYLDIAHEEALLEVSEKNDFPSAAERNAAAAQYPKVRVWRELALEAEVQRKALHHQVQSLERIIKVLSRELTRRIGEMERTMA